MIKIEIRKADILDLQDIINLEKGFDSDRYSDNIIKDCLDSNSYITIIALSDGKAIGYLTASVVLNEGELLKIIVDRNYRSLGCGTMLIEKLLKELSDLNVDKVFLEVRESNIHAKKLYEKIGFTKLYQREKYYDNKEDAEIYWYNLNAKN